MKIGFRKPSIKKSIKARTTGKIKRKVKKAVNPFYGKKGMGYINDPKKAVYNKVYNKTTFGTTDIINAATKTSSKNSNSTKQYSVNTENPVEKKKGVSNATVIILLIIFFPVGLYLMWAKTGWNKTVKIIISVIFALLIIIGLMTPGDSGNTNNETIAVGVTTQTTTEPETTETTATTATTTTTTETTTTTTTTTTGTTTKETTTEQTTKDNSRTVYITPTGEKYHYSKACAGKNAMERTYNEVKDRYDPCKKCAQ